MATCNEAVGLGNTTDLDQLCPKLSSKEGGGGIIVHERTLSFIQHKSHRIVCNLEGFFFFFFFNDFGIGFKGPGLVHLRSLEIN